MKISNEDLSKLSKEQRILFLLKEMQEEVQRYEKRDVEPLAVIGMACRFPGANNPEEFWDMLLSGRDGITDIPGERWSVEKFYDSDPEKEGRIYVRKAGIVKDIDKFDAEFFRISPKEAEAMDPQQRLLMEVSYHALENAGIPLKDLEGSKTGVFVGISTAEYGQGNGEEREIGTYTASGNSLNVSAGRISYFLGARGPAMAIDTACSSSLTALHVACRSLRSGESNLAIVGGVNLLLSSSSFQATCRAKMLSPDGRCKTFDETANGYGRGEGCGVLLLKRLSDLQDGERPLALIRGSAINQDGASSGLTVPNRIAQQEVISAALENAKVEPSQVTLVEAHGTGTSLGDPIEVLAIKNTYDCGRGQDKPLYLGSVKSNVGHLESAAGISGVIKAILALKHKVIPPHIGMKRLNPKIELEGSAIKIPDRPIAWENGSHPRMAAVSSFGFSGSNAHVILSEAAVDVNQVCESSSSAPCVLALSATNKTAMREVEERFVRYLSGSASSDSWQNICRTSLLHRTHLGERLAVVARNAGEAAELLKAHLEGENPRRVCGGTISPGGRRKLVFVFSGSGAQWVGMANELLEQEPVFREAVLECDRIFAPMAGWSLVEEMKRPAEISKVFLTEYGHPILFAIQAALTALLRHYGVVPDSVLGHSVGEIAAAYASQALGLDESLRLVMFRSRLIQKVHGKGKVLSVSLSREQLERMLAGSGISGELSVCVHNGPSKYAVSGVPEAVGKFEKYLSHQAVECKMVDMEFAAHGPQMDPLKEELRVQLSGMRCSEAKIPFFSTVSGEAIGKRLLDEQYWADNLRQPVKFAETIEAAKKEGAAIFLEMGPHPILTSSIKEICSGEEVSVLASLRKGGEDRLNVLNALAGLHCLGQGLRLDLVVADGELASIPSYPFQGQRYWVKTRKASHLDRTEGGHPLLENHISLASDKNSHFWETGLSGEYERWVKDHLIRGKIIFPGAGYVEIAVSAGKQVASGSSYAVENLEFMAPLFLEADAEKRLQVSVQPGTSKDEMQLGIFSRDVDSEWKQHSKGTIRIQNGKANAIPEDAEFPEALLEGKVVGKEEIYQRYREIGFELGPTFRGIQEIRLGDGELLGKVEIPTEMARPEDYHFPPSSWDAFFQNMLGGLAFEEEKDKFYLPASIDRVQVFGAFSGPIWCHLKYREQNESSVKVDMALFNAKKAMVGIVSGFTIRRLSDSVYQSISQASRAAKLYGQEWVDVPRATAKSETGTWLIIDDAIGTGGALRQLFEKRGVRSAILKEINKSTIESSVADGELNGVLYLRGMDYPTTDETTPESLRVASEEACGGLLSLLQGMDGILSKASPEILIVTRGAQAVNGGGDVVSVGQSTLWGMGKSIAAEYPALNCRLIDLDPKLGEDHRGTDDQELRMLIEEALSVSEETQVAFRDGARKAARLTKLRVAKGAHGQFTLHSDATYLITGGMGGIGKKLAYWFAKNGATSLVLMGRRELQPEDQASLDELKSKGCDAVYLRGDISDKKVLAQLRDMLVHGLPSLKGVVHAAGIVEDGMILQQSMDSYHKAFSPKVYGGWSLCQLAKTEKLDFVALFSSLSALVGSGGQSNYSAANAFLDEAAAWLRHQGVPAASIQWGPWEEVGLAANDRVEKNLKQRGIGYLSVSDGLKSFANAMSLGRARVAVLDIAWQKFFEHETFLQGKPFFQELAGEFNSPSTSHDQVKVIEELSKLKTSERKAGLQRHVLGIVRKQLGYSAERELDPRAGFFDLGIDSLMAVDIKARLERDLARSLPASLLFNFPNVASLSGALFEQIWPQEALQKEEVGQDAKAESEKELEEIKALSEGEVKDLLKDLLQEEMVG